MAIADVHHKHRIYAFLSNVVEGRLRRFMRTWLWENLLVLRKPCFGQRVSPNMLILQTCWFGDTNRCSQHCRQLAVDWNCKDPTPTSAPSKRSGKGRDSEMTWCSDVEASKYFMGFVLLQDISGRAVITCQLQSSVFWIDKINQAVGLGWHQAEDYSERSGCLGNI